MSSGRSIEALDNELRSLMAVKHVRFDGAAAPGTVVRSREVRFPWPPAVERACTEVLGGGGQPRGRRTRRMSRLGSHLVIPEDFLVVVVLDDAIPVAHDDVAEADVGLLLSWVRYRSG